MFVRDVEIEPISLERLAPLLLDERVRALEENVAAAHELLDGRVVWNVNATATGGGVAEMLQALLAYSRGAGVDTRWLVLGGSREFFAVTKRLHNFLHGTKGDGGDLGEAERAAYEQALAPDIEDLCARVSKDDIVLLHDPQTAGMIAAVKETGAKVVWRSHIGRDTPNEQTDLGWQFLRPYVEGAHAVVFSRAQYAPDWLDPELVRVIPPSLDPFSAKNADLEEPDVLATLRKTGLVEVDDGHGTVEFTARDGSKGSVEEHGDLFVAGETVPKDARIVMQVSRWDRLKDMDGVMKAFTEHLEEMPDDAHLMLVGPDVYGVSDDPEGEQVLDECVEQWKALPPEAQARVHLVALPMDDIAENAHIVNALQHHADVVVQKSLVEGFGLTVTEPMWKGRAVVASKVGGIQDQIVDGESGLLLADPEDLDAFADLLVTVLSDETLASRLGEAARQRVTEQYLGDRHLIQYVELFRELLTG